MPKSAYEQLAQAISGKASSLTEAERNGLKALLDSFKISFPSFTVTVNYDQTVEELIKVGKYDWKNNNIISSYFASAEKGQVGVTIHLFNFDHDISSEDAIREMEGKGFRPATLKELLTLGAAHPDLQRSNPIVALGSIWRRPARDVCVPCLNGDRRSRDLCLYWWIGDWDSTWRFAAVRK